MDRLEINLVRAAFGLVLAGSLAAMASYDSLELSRPSETRAALVAQGPGGVRLCQLRDGARLVQVPLGSELTIDGKRRACELYDGHPVLVHSAERSPGSF